MGRICSLGVGWFNLKHVYSSSPLALSSRHIASYCVVLVARAQELHQSTAATAAELGAAKSHGAALQRELDQAVELCGAVQGGCPGWCFACGDALGNLVGMWG